MKQKRYAIVRVDGSCPNKLENLSAPCITSCKRFDCKNCRYGDTKEQWIRKVMTAFKIAIKEKREGKMPKENVNRWVAEIVVEFLGVK